MRVSGDVYAGVVGSGCDLEVWEAFVVCEVGVVGRADVFYEACFLQGGVNFVWCFEVIDGGCFVCHLYDLRSAGGYKVCGFLEIAGGAGSEVLCFADVEDGFFGVFEEV